jgi:hypothetical protein
VENETLSSPRRICNIFNSIFFKTALLEIRDTELTKAFHSLKSNKSAGLDDISPYLLKKCVPYMLKPLLELVNASIREVIFLLTLKNQ